jgi:hypothetical protein
MIQEKAVTHQELQQFSEAVGLSRAAPGRVSTILMFEVYCRALVPSVPGDPNKIVAEIRALEGVGRLVGTKPPSRFKHPPLRGLWKKHYLLGGVASVARNVELGFGSGRRRLREIIKRNHHPSTAHLPPAEIARKIASEVVDLYAERSTRQALTGEWIVFGQHEGKNYYLCLARHDENNNDIYDRVLHGYSSQFPFLFSEGDQPAARRHSTSESVECND